MSRGSTVILKGAVIAIGLVALALCVFVLPLGIRATQWDGYRPILIGMYVSALPFFVALYQALKLLGYIDKNQGFSHLSVRALKYIKYSAAAVSCLYSAGMPYIFYVADKDDAPGVIVIGGVIIFASFVTAVAATVFEKLFENAIAIKSENDLTV